ncbi:MAG: glycosyltransferase family 9 protein [Armatimonadetes bacterium]|nr:glycosyltransferase family 9 protein [Armatimonadota bacterium]NCO92165.1 glycosyltransferase family 9 protein [Armatimonadota bacterium]NCP32520.1 glycosyltransferase family 9 protein [Armatimonadota bacterium]NCQ26929.1 glycosyltransferase family 9 protein [Armatimonadota bacterium]NDK15011.1 glycosyltransferase family 9 protein [Armatimonadota bacterium]
MSKILIVRLSAAGDVIQTTPIARQIRRQHPDCHLAWVIERKALPGIAHNPHVDEIVTIDSPEPRAWLAAIRRLRKRFDIVVDAQCLLKSGLLTRLTAAPVRIGRQDARGGSRRCYTRLMPTHMNQTYISQQYLEQCADLGLDVDDYVPELHLAADDHQRAAALWQELGLEGRKPVVALIAFSAEPTREWSADRFAQVGDLLSERVGATCLVPGSKAEVSRAEALIARMQCRPRSLAGRTTLGEAAALLSRCDLAIGADTGLIHYSLALGVPLVCLLGPSPLRNGPKADTAVTLASPCKFRHCQPAEKCKRGEGRPCMDEITVEAVVEAAEALLARGRQPRGATQPPATRR